MGNNLNGNPKWVDTAATVWSNQPTRVKEILWVDDAADIVDNDDLVLTIDGVVITTKVQVPPGTLTEPGNGLTYFCSRPDAVVNTFTVTTIDHGALIIWVD